MPEKPSNGAIVSERGRYVTFLKREDAIEFRDVIARILDALFSRRFKNLSKKAEDVRKRLDDYKFDFIQPIDQENHFHLQWLERHAATDLWENGSEIFPSDKSDWRKCKDNETIKCLDIFYSIIESILLVDAFEPFALGNPVRQGTTQKYCCNVPYQTCSKLQHEDKPDFLVLWEAFINSKREYIEYKDLSIRLFYHRNDVEQLVNNLAEALELEKVNDIDGKPGRGRPRGSRVLTNENLDSTLAIF